MNLTVASEYLVMAAELIELKSRLLLPNSKNDEDDEYEEDPRENLINRLVEYKNIKIWLIHLRHSKMIEETYIQKNQLI